MSQYKNVKPCMINISTKDRILVKVGPEQVIELDDADAKPLVETGYLVEVKDGVTDDAEDAPKKRGRPANTGN